MPIVIPSRDWGDLESPWISTDLSTWETPLRHGRLREYQPREQVFRQGEDFSSVYIVESGRVRVSVCHADGQEKTLYVADTGAMIGESDCILGQPYSSTATVVLPSRVRAVPSALVQELFHADPVFADWLLQYQARKVRLLLEQNMTLSFDRARQRVAKTLLYLCGQYGRQKEDGIWLTNRFTCSDVAGITNVSRVSVNLIFREWEEAGILTRAHGRCCIRDPEELRRLAEPDCGPAFPPAPADRHHARTHRQAFPPERESPPVVFSAASAGGGQPIRKKSGGIRFLREKNAVLLA